jgi:hypothetical protein
MPTKKYMITALMQARVNPFRSFSSWNQEPKSNIEELFKDAKKLGLIY